jgi:DNA-directed RNA polymerase specialized sigma24 family protein
MKARDFLRQLEKIDRMIENKRIEAEQWREIACGTTSHLGERVKSSGSQQKMADAIDRYLDIEIEISNKIAELAETRWEIISTIDQLPVAEYDLLHKVYVQHYQLQEVADMLDKSYSWVTTVHGQALANVQKILDKRQNKEFEAMEEK